MNLGFLGVAVVVSWVVEEGGEMVGGRKEILMSAGSTSFSAGISVVVVVVSVT